VENYILAGTLCQTNMDCFRCDRSDRNDDWQDICDSRTHIFIALSVLTQAASEQ